MKRKNKTPRAQLDRVRAWNAAHPEQKAAIRKKWEQSPSGQAWLKANQAKKNAARAAWRKRKQKAGQSYS